MKIKTLTILTIIVVSNYLHAQTDLIFKSGMEFVPKINDTGINWSGEYPTGNLTECNGTTTALQDCNTGRDVTHNDDSDGHSGFSFTKLDANGIPLVDQSVDYAITPWSCVQDNVTGLIWEVKTIDNKLNAFRWGGITAIGLGHPNAAGTFYNDWDEIVYDSNQANGLCGFTDWRVPKVDELLDLANLSTFNPAIDTNYFPNTVSLDYWSSSPVAGSEGNAWVVNFIHGDGGRSHRGFSHHVRLVRGFGQ